MSLYTDDNPETTMKGLGFKDAETAKKTINKIKRRSKVYQKQVVITMYYRAKYHPYKTKKMKEAMKIFEKWMKKEGIAYK